MIVARVRQNKHNGQMILTVPVYSGFAPGDIVELRNVTQEVKENEHKQTKQKLHSK